MVNPPESDAVKAYRAAHNGCIPGDAGWSASTFEHGKTYRTVGGHTMKVTVIGADSLAAQRIDGEPFERVTLMYEPNGIPIGPSWAAYQLLPGAIEDEPKAEQPDDTDSVIWRLGIQAQIDSLNEKLDDAMQSGKAQTTDLFRRIRDNSSSLDNALIGTGREVELQDQRIAQLTEAVTQLQADAIARGDRELNAAVEQMDEQTATPEQILEACDIAEPGAGGFLTEEQGAAIVAAAREHANMRIALRKVPSGTIQMEPEPAEDREYRSDLRQIHSRLNRQAERFEELSHKLETAMGSGKAQNDEIRSQLRDLRSHTGRYAMSQHIEALYARIEALEKAAEAMPGPYAMGQRLEALEEQMTAALGITLGARPRPATPVEQAIQALDGRINDLENYTGLDVRSANRQAAERDLTDLRKSMLDQVAEWPVAGGCKSTVVDSASWTGRPKPPKPTIKGGWVNVYLMPDGHGHERLVDWNRTIGVIWTSRAYATSYRKPDAIACIQIPDIQEGEGL